MTDTIKISRELLELALSNVLQGPPLDRIVKAKQELRKALATPPVDAADMGGQAGEEVEVVGYLDAHDCLWNETTHPDRMIPLMTVGQHQRIVAVISAQQSAHVCVPRERIQIALEAVQNAMEDAYNNAYQKCCGRGGSQCCGDPEPAWSDADHAIMDALTPAQRELCAILNGGEA